MIVYTRQHLIKTALVLFRTVIILAQHQETQLRRRNGAGGGGWGGLGDYAQFFKYLGGGGYAFKSP